MCVILNYTLVKDLAFACNVSQTNSDAACQHVRAYWKNVARDKSFPLAQEVATAEQSGEAEPATARTEKQADDKATDIKEEAEAAGAGVDVEKSGNELRVTKESGEQIYIGFEKGDKDRTKGGRVISDDPSRYPDRTQTTGGWAGGEQGLAAFIEVYYHPELNALMLGKDMHTQLCLFACKVSVYSCRKLSIESVIYCKLACRRSKRSHLPRTLLCLRIRNKQGRKARSLK